MSKESTPKLPVVNIAIKITELNNVAAAPNANVPVSNDRVIFKGTVTGGQPPFHITAWFKIVGTTQVPMNPQVKAFSNMPPFNWDYTVTGMAQYIGTWGDAHAHVRDGTVMGGPLTDEDSVSHVNLTNPKVTSGSEGEAVEE